MKSGSRGHRARPASRRGARHPDEADIGIVDAPARLPVIVINRKRHRIDAREIFVVEQMLLPQHAAALAAEVGRQRQCGSTHSQ